jgi:hypothetical protein
MHAIPWLLIAIGSTLAYRCFAGQWPLHHFHATARRDARRQAEKRASSTTSGLQAQLRQAQHMARKEGWDAWRNDDS